MIALLYYPKVTDYDVLTENYINHKVKYKDIIDLFATIEGVSRAKLLRDVSLSPLCYTLYYTFLIPQITSPTYGLNMVHNTITGNLPQWSSSLKIILADSTNHPDTEVFEAISTIFKKMKVFIQ